MKNEILILGTEQLGKFIRERDGVIYFLGAKEAVKVDWPIEQLYQIAEPTPLDKIERFPPHFPYVLGSFKIPSELIEQWSIQLVKSALSPYGLIAATHNFPVSIVGIKQNLSSKETISDIYLEESVVNEIENEMTAFPKISSQNGETVKTAVLDTGISPSASNVINCDRNMLDTTGQQPQIVNCNDNDGHGTAIALLIGRLGSANTRIVPICVTDPANGKYGTIRSVIQGFVYASDVIRADIANASVAVEPPQLEETCPSCGSPITVYEATRDANSFLEVALGSLSSRMLIMAAAGNRPNHRTIAIPASSSGVVAIGAAWNGKVADYSLWQKNNGSILFAPGGNHRAPIAIGTLTPAYGTSFSCAIASSVATRHLISFPCKLPRNVPIPVLIKRLYKCGREFNLPNGEKGVSVIPMKKDFSNEMEIREFCRGYCVAYEDWDSYTKIYRGRHI